MSTLPNPYSQKVSDFTLPKVIKEGYVNRQHISIQQLEAAMRDLINAYNLLELPKCWGTGKKAAADGSKFEVYENNLMSEYHIRYGGYGGIAYHQQFSLWKINWSWAGLPTLVLQS